MSKKSFLDSIQSPSPCTKDWNEMIGGERIRFCQSCEKDVHNLSAMSRSEARKLVARNAGKICVRYVRLPNGKVQTADTKLYKIGERASKLAAGVFGATLTLSALANAQTPPSPKHSTAGTAESQNKDNSKTSQISFTIYDVTDAVIPGTEVKLTNKKTKEEFVALTNQEGAAHFSLIPRGRYDVLVSSSIGFQSYQQVVQIKEAIEPNIKITLSVGSVVDDFIVDWSEIPLFRAVAQDDNATVKQLINSGFNIETKDENGETALHSAVEHGNLEIVEFLLDKGAKVTVKDKSKRTPLAMVFHSFAHNDDAMKKIIRLLVSKGANADVRDDEKITLLMAACEGGDLEVVKFLLEAGANPNLKDEDGETALQKTNSEEIKQLLKRYGAKQ